MTSFISKSITTSLEQIKAVALLPACKKNPATVLYANNARTFFFRLEALARIGRYVYDKKRFDKLYKTFKSYEDALGAIDYYDAFKKAFEIEKLPKSFLNSLGKTIVVKTNELNTLATEDNLCSTVFFEKITSKLNETEWMPAEEERKEFCKFIIRQIEKIEEDFSSGELNFNNIESGIHEVRRRIRWLSIYTAVADGVVQVQKVDLKDSPLAKYATKEIMASPFNIFPKPLKGINPIYLHAGNFYALSWLINELGILKDEGLKRMAFEEAIKTTTVANITDLRKKHLSPLRTNKQLCETAETMVEEFVFTHRVFERLKRDLMIAKKEIKN